MIKVLSSEGAPEKAFLAFLNHIHLSGEGDRVECVTFKTESELRQRLSEQTFDLFIVYLANVLWENQTSFRNVAPLLQRLHIEHWLPIIAMQGMSLQQEFAGTGVVFLEMPCDVGEMRLALKRCGVFAFRGPCCSTGSGEERK